MRFVESPAFSCPLDLGMTVAMCTVLVACQISSQPSYEACISNWSTAACVELIGVYNTATTAPMTAPMTLCPKRPSALLAAPLLLAAAAALELPVELPIVAEPLAMEEAPIVADPLAMEELLIMADPLVIAELPLIMDEPLIIVDAPPAAADPPDMELPLVGAAVLEALEPEQPAEVGRLVTPAPLQRLAANWYVASSIWSVLLSRERYKPCNWSLYSTQLNLISIQGNTQLAPKR